MLTRSGSTHTRLAAYALLGLAAGASFMLPRTLTVPTISAAPPDQIALIGTVRDFHRTHPDFDAAPAAGFGHYAGTVQTALGGDGRPVLADGSPGSAWRDSDEDLMAYWKFDDGGGLTATDVVGANPGTLVGGPVWDAGSTGGALRFDGVDDHVNVPSSPEIQITGDVTFAGWFKLDEDFDASSPDTMVIMEKFLDTEHDFHIALTGGDYNRPEVPKGTLVFKVENGPDSDYYRYKWTNRTSWTAGTWYHFAATLTSSDTTGNTLFINGVDDTNPVDAGGVGFVDTDYDAPFRIGGKTVDYNGFATDIFFKGVIDDVKIFRRALVTEDFAPPSAGGFKVATQWTDSMSRPIAPHLFYATYGTGVRVQETLTLGDDCLIDSFRAGAGEYGMGGNQGADAPVSTNSVMSGGIDVASASASIEGDVLVGPGGDPGIVITGDGTITGTTGAQLLPYPMPVITAPDDTVVGPNLGNVWYKDDPFTISSNMHVDDLRISNDAVVRIDGSVTILVEGQFRTETRGVLQVLPGSSLDLYVRGDVTIETKSSWSDPRNTRMHVIGSPQMKLQTEAAFYGTILAPDAHLLVQTKGELFGSFIGRSLECKTQGMVHVDLDGGTLPACVTVEDTAGVAGAADTGGVSSTSSFNEWFRDIPGVNQSAAHTITLTRDGGGVYTYFDDAFYPLDGRLLGNEGDATNNYFTYHIRADFQYAECLAQYLEFEGGDGVWVFIDGQLVLDLGGMRAADGQFVELDRLGLTDGETYELDLFYAQRQVADSVFRLRTTLELSTAGRTPTVSAMFD